jgi:hypothetical protein
MEHRRKRTAHSVEDTTSQKNAAPAALSLPNIAELIKYGEITVGEQRPIGCIATACDEDSTLAMLLRRKGETLFQLLTRLDQAIAKAYTQGVFTDEINPPPPQLPRP